MRNRRSIAMMLLAIVALAAANLYVARQGREAPHVTRTALLEGSFPAPDSLQISAAGADTVKLVDDGGWRLSAPYTEFVDGSVVNRLLDSLYSATVIDSLADSELERLGSSRERLGLTRPRLRLAIGSREVRTEFAFGDAAPTGDGIYVAVEGERHVYLVPTNVLASVCLTVNDFRLREVVDFSPSDMVSLDLKRGTGSLMRFVRSDDGWRMVSPREARAGTERLKKLLEAISSVKVNDWIWPRGGTNEAQIVSSSLLAGYGLDPDSTLTISIKNVKGEDVRLSLGDPAEGDSIYALMPGGAAIVTIDAGLKELAIGESAYFTDLRLFPVDRKLVETVSITDGGLACLLRRGAGGGWTMEAPVEAPVDEAAAEELLTRMLALGPSDIAVSNGVTVSVSTNLPSVSVARVALFAEGGLEILRSRRVLKVDPAVVKRLVISGLGESPVAAAYNRETKKWSLERTASGADSAAEDSSPAEPDGEALDAIAAAMNPLTAVGVARLKPASARLGEYGLDKPYRTIAVDTVGENSARRTVLLGEMTAGGGRYATVGAADAVFVLSAESVDVLTHAITRP